MNLRKLGWEKKMIQICSFERCRERRKRTDLPFIDFLLKCLQEPGLDHGHHQRPFQVHQQAAGQKVQQSEFKPSTVRWCLSPNHIVNLLWHIYPDENKMAFFTPIHWRDTCCVSLFWLILLSTVVSKCIHFVAKDKIFLWWSSVLISLSWVDDKLLSHEQMDIWIYPKSLLLLAGLPQTWWHT